MLLVVCNATLTVRWAAQLVNSTWSLQALKADAHGLAAAGLLQPLLSTTMSCKQLLSWLPHLLLHRRHLAVLLGVLRCVLHHLLQALAAMAGEQQGVTQAASSAGHQHHCN
eukprot:GHRQ01023872.1.p2 GENE.GHRQ01023872.1~~GHRQ01023872.1.p2  ORF type:complete len:111 (-),score=20.90 GHRQ01023872.1:440-772(-)